MKKIISVLMVAVALMMAAPAQAQLIKFGVKGGMNFSELDLNNKEAKAVVDEAPKMIKEAVSKEEANMIKEKLEAEGAKITIK